MSISLDQDHRWTQDEQDENGYVATCLRCAKSIAQGRVCNAPAHRACDSCARNNKAGCHSVGRVGTEPLVAWDLCSDLYVDGPTAIKRSSGCAGCATPEE